MIFRICCLLIILPIRPTHAADWIFAKAYKLPSEYTNQESGYFSIIEGKNGKLYIGTAKYGVNAYLLEFDPKTEKVRMVMDVHDTIGSKASGFAAQAKIHSRNNVGTITGKIYVASKQGYPEKGESRDAYPGGYVLTHDPATGKNEHYGIAKPKHGIISVMPDEENGVAYISTCSDDRPIDHTHFMILDLKTRTYTDLGDMEHAYAFIVLDEQHRAYHPVRGGLVARYDPRTKTLDKLTMTVDGKPVPNELSKDGAIQNWDTTADRKTLYCVELSTNQLYAFDLTAAGDALPGRSLGKLLPFATKTDCRAMAVSPHGVVWMAVTHTSRPEGQTMHLVSYTPGDPAPRDHGPVAIRNPEYVTLTGPDGKLKPWHHTLRKEKDGIWTPWQPLGIAAASDGTPYVVTIAPFTL
ncbi:MAG: SMP-30/gluconolactonase/LRE family protein, partial [Nitrospira sp.]|nr:SMP-30/gluconolactonase/LRE family protein [Nitrospira sp.]